MLGRQEAGGIVDKGYKLGPLMPTAANFRDMITRHLIFFEEIIIQT